MSESKVEERNYTLPDGDTLVVSEESILHFTVGSGMPMLTTEAQVFNSVLALVDKQAEALKDLEQENKNVKRNRRLVMLAWDEQASRSSILYNETLRLRHTLRTGLTAIETSISVLEMEQRNPEMEPLASLLDAQKHLQYQLYQVDALEKREREKRDSILTYLNSLPVVEMEQGDDAYVLVKATQDVKEKLEKLGVSLATVAKYTQDDNLCILALAYSEGYAGDYTPGVGLVAEEVNV
jgi:hypothetical protein